MTRKYCAFDLEIVKDIPQGCKDWKSIRPLGISCAATILTGETRPVTWYHGQNDPEPLAGPMTLDELDELVDYLHFMMSSGYTPLTHNGLAFDFDILSEESKRFDDCKKIALASVDTMFHFLAVKGHPIGLQTLASGQGHSGKTEGMHGDLAPVLWRGSIDDRKKVLTYVGQDARTTLEVAEICEKNGRVAWISKAGKTQWLALPNGWMTILECMDYPLPDTSWMTNPMKKEDLLAWTQK